MCQFVDIVCNGIFVHVPKLERQVQVCDVKFRMLGIVTKVLKVLVLSLHHVRVYISQSIRDCG